MNDCYCFNKLNQCYCFNQTNEFCSLNNLNKYSSFNKIIKEKKHINESSIFINIPNKELLLTESPHYKFIEFTKFDSLKNSEYGNFSELDISKSKIDLLDTNLEKYRRAATKYLHEYELVKLICKKRVISRAYFKLYELIFFEDIINLHNLDCLFICEAPGGFIECITDIRRKRNLRTSYISISAQNDIKYDKYLDSENLLYGDITNIEIIDQSIDTIIKRYPNKLDLITADGGFDIKNFNSQEIISNKLILCEIYIAIKTQKKNGMFIVKYFDMFTHNSVISYLILCTFYKTVKIIKPKTSRNSNSERYLVCSSFNDIDESNIKLILELEDIIKNYVIKYPDPNNEEEYGIYTLIYPSFNFDTIPHFKEEIKNFNNSIISKQIKTIDDSINMVYIKDYYFQNLLLKLFIDNVSLNNLIFYKNILYTRINKCIDWLRLYKINTYQIVYRIDC